MLSSTFRHWGSSSVAATIRRDRRARIQPCRRARRHPSRRRRDTALSGLASLAFGLVGSLVAFRAQFLLHGNGGDHLTLWNAARMLLAGGDPYPRPASAMTIFYYPLPAAL